MKTVHKKTASFGDLRRSPVCVMHQIVGLEHGTRAEPIVIGENTARHRQIVDGVIHKEKTCSTEKLTNPLKI